MQDFALINCWLLVLFIKHATSVLMIWSQNTELSNGGKKKTKKKQQIGWKKNRESDGKNWLRAFKASNRKKKVGPLKTRTLLNGYTTWQKANSKTDMGVKRHIIV